MNINESLFTKAFLMTTIAPNSVMSAPQIVSPLLGTYSPALIARFTQMPKANTHCHLGGEYVMQKIWDMANDQQKAAIESSLRAFAETKDYKKAFEIFPIVGKVVDTHERLRIVTLHACEKFRSDNNQYVLLRTNLKVLEQQNYEAYLNTVVSAIEEVEKEGNFKVGLMLSVSRATPLDVAEKTVEIAIKHKGRVVGIDISGKCNEGDIRTIMKPLKDAKEAHLKIAVHMGELPDEPDQMEIINNLSPDLIDHGVNLCPEALDWITKNKVPVTICLTSSYATTMHPHNETHPWIKRDLPDHMKLLGTDDEMLFGASLTQEYLILSDFTSPEKAQKIAEQSIIFAKNFIESTQPYLEANLIKV